MIEELRSLIGNERGIIHKKLLGIGKGLVGAIPGIGTAFSTATGIISAITAKGQQKQIGLSAKFPELGPTVLGPPTPCPSGFVRTRSGCVPSGGQRIHPGNGQAQFCDPGFVWSPRLRTCVAVDSPVGAGFRGGVPVLGQHGAGMVAGSRIVDVATCNKGMVLGDDGVCYNKRQISNKERMWPAGRKPLLTGGQMNAISIAARAGGRLELATKRLQKMGMMKKPARRAGVPAGHRAQLVHQSEH